MRTDNLILDALTEPTRTDVLRSAEFCNLVRKAKLFRPGRPRYVYFLTEGVASVKSVLRNGSSSEVAIYGRASAPGAIALLGLGNSITECEMESPGAAYRIKFSVATDLFAQRADFRLGILDLVHDHIRVQDLIAVCCASHTLEQRLAKWLMCFSDLLGSHDLPLTHEDIAQLLSARRSTIALATGRFRVAGLIAQGRGRITIQDAPGLLRHACDCYPAWRSVFRKRHKTNRTV